jgi:hypothetical protein
MAGLTNTQVRICDAIAKINEGRDWSLMTKLDRQLACWLEDGLTRANSAPEAEAFAAYLEA